VKFEEINLKFQKLQKRSRCNKVRKSFKKVQDPHSITTVIERHLVLSTL